MLMINLYVNESDTNVVDKNITTIHSNVAYEFKTETSMTSPVIFIDRSLWNDSINYVYIDELNRFFFVKDVKFMTGKMIALICEVDVLMSFRSELKKETAILERQTSLANLYFNDSELPIENRINQTFKLFPNGLENHAYYYLLIGG